MRAIDQQTACRTRTLRRLALFACAAAFFACFPARSAAQSAAPNPAPSSPDGVAIYARRCLLCHGPGGRGPQLPALRKMKSDVVYSMLTDGIMQQQASGLSEQERHAVADYVGKKDSVTSPVAAVPACPAAAWKAEAAPGDWNGWSPEVSNLRAQPAAGLSAADLGSLQLKWAFVFPDTASASNPVTVIGNRIFVGSFNGVVYSLDARSGCSYWTFTADSGVRTAVTIAGGRAYFGDFKANAYALDAATGTLIWKSSVDDHPYARITGSPVVYGDRMFVPVSSLEEGVALDPGYSCCTFRGSLAALDTRDGKRVWKSPTIDEPLKPMGVNKAGVARFGPSGAAVWSAPTVDGKRKTVYVTTGNNYSGPDAAATDAVIAFDLATGARRWIRSLRPNDQWNAGCMGDKVNCPDEEGPDFDFGASAMLVTLPNGHDTVLAGQKSGMLYALDPDKGTILWEVRLGKGNSLGGIEWGMAADARRAYVAIADWDVAHPEVADGAMTAVDLATGKLAWRTPNPAGTCAGRPATCSSAMAAAVTVAGDMVFEGSVDGFLRAYDPATGRQLWEFDTAREFTGVGGGKGHGGSVNGAGAAVAGGLVFQTSGYAAYGLGMPGNVLLVFGPPDKGGSKAAGR